MATPDGKVTFDAGGKSLCLCFNTNRLCLLEDRLEKSTLDIATELQFNPRVATIRAMFWAGLGDGEMTLASAGELIDQLGMQKAVAFAKQAFNAAFPAPETNGKEGGANPTGAAAG